MKPILWKESVHPSLIWRCHFFLGKLGLLFLSTVSHFLDSPTIKVIEKISCVCSSGSIWPEALFLSPTQLVLMTPHEDAFPVSVCSQGSMNSKAEQAGWLQFVNTTFKVGSTAPLGCTLIIWHLVAMFLERPALTPCMLLMAGRYTPLMPTDILSTAK